MKPIVQSYDADREYYFDEGCFINELSNTEADESVSIARARVEPGVTTEWHQLIDTVERYVITQGSGSVEVGDLAARQVGEGDVVIIPAGVRQRISNSGEADLVFLAICSPRFEKSNYVRLD